MSKSRQRALKKPTATTQPLGAAEIDTREHIQGNRKSLKHPCEGNWNTHTHRSKHMNYKDFSLRAAVKGFNHLCRTENSKNTHAKNTPHKQSRSNCSFAAMNSFSHGSDVWAVPPSLAKPTVSPQLTCELSLAGAATTKVLLRQFCHDKSSVVTKDMFCHDKRIVVTLSLIHI